MNYTQPCRLQKVAAVISSSSTHMILRFKQYLFCL